MGTMDQYTRYETLFGDGALQWRDGLVVSHCPPGTAGARIAVQGALAPTTGDARRLTGMLQAYFAGERVEFTAAGLPIDWGAGSPFQQRVARALAAIPFGETVTYAGLAILAGRPGAARAVGNFMAANPLPVLLPCHRVIRADGGWGRYSAGADYKRRLLRMEAAVRDTRVPSGRRPRTAGSREYHPAPIGPEAR